MEYIKHGHGKPPRWEPELGDDVTDAELESGDEHPYGHTIENFQDFDPSTGYYLEKLFGHQRQGFIWQKASRAAQLRFPKDAEQGLQRAAAHARVHRA